MVALPISTEFNGSTITEGQFRTAMGELRGFLRHNIGTVGNGNLATEQPTQTLGASSQEIVRVTNANVTFERDIVSNRVLRASNGFALGRDGSVLFRSAPGGVVEANAPFTASGLLTATAGLTVSGNIAANNDLTVSNDLTVNGGLTVNGSFDASTVTSETRSNSIIADTLVVGPRKTSGGQDALVADEYGAHITRNVSSPDPSMLGPDTNLHSNIFSISRSGLATSIVSQSGTARPSISGSAFFAVGHLYRVTSGGRGGGCELTGIVSDDTGGFSANDDGVTRGIAMRVASRGGDPTSNRTRANAVAIIQMEALSRTGGSLTNDDYNVLSVAHGRGTSLIVSSEGDIFASTTSNTLDTLDDISALATFETVRSPDHAIRARALDWAKYNEDDLIEAGVLGDTIDNGGMTNVTQLQRLHTGALIQLGVENKIMRELLIERNPELAAEYRARLDNTGMEAIA